MAKQAPLVTLGTWVDGYQAIEQAPVEYIQGSRTRDIDGRSVRGSWSDPWWLYDRERGWALAKHWKNREQETRAWPGARATWVTIPARYEVVIEPWSPHCVPGRRRAVQDRPAYRQADRRPPG
jgi:hypothetical protein